VSLFELHCLLLRGAEAVVLKEHVCENNLREEMETKGSDLKLAYAQDVQLIQYFHHREAVPGDHKLIHGEAEKYT